MHPITRRPTPFVLVSTGHGSMILNANDRALGPWGGYFGVGHQLLTASFFDPEEVRLLIAILDFRRRYHGDGVVALDCGANIGVHTIEWARHMTGWGEVLAIEAQERLYYALAGNIALNNCFNARAIHAAVGAEDGEFMIPTPDYAREASFGSLELRKVTTEDIGQAIDYSEASMTPIRITRVDSLAMERLDLIKIDVEGMEMAVLTGAEETIRRCGPVVQVETLKTPFEAISSFFLDLGYLGFRAVNSVFVRREDPVAAHIRGAETIGR